MKWTLKTVHTCGTKVSYWMNTNLNTQTTDLNINVFFLNTDPSIKIQSWTSNYVLTQIRTHTVAVLPAELHVTLNNLQLKLPRSRPPDVFCDKALTLFRTHKRDILLHLRVPKPGLHLHDKEQLCESVFLLDWYVFNHKHLTGIYQNAKEKTPSFPLGSVYPFILYYLTKRSNKPHRNSHKQSCLYIHTPLH